MQLTEEQVDEWADDANVMLSEENMGGTGVRASAEALLQSLVTCGSGSSGPAALAAALHQRLAEAEAVRSQQPAVKVRHACNQCCCNGYLLFIQLKCRLKRGAVPVRRPIVIGYLPHTYVPCSSLPWSGTIFTMRRHRRR
jgi:hypothetical protein